MSREVFGEPEILDSLTNHAVHGSGDLNEEQHTCEKLKNVCHFTTKIWWLGEKPQVNAETAETEKEKEIIESCQKTTALAHLFHKIYIYVNINMNICMCVCTP